MVQLALHVLYNFALENLSLPENLLHCHCTDNDASLALNDTLDNVLDMIATGAGRRGVSLFGFTPREEQNILSKIFMVVVWADSKHRWQRKLEFLNGHCLQGDFEVERAD